MRAMEPTVDRDEQVMEDVKRLVSATSVIRHTAPSQIELIRSFMAGMQAADAINEANKATA